MSNLSRLWAGNLFGTNTGKVFAELALAGQEVSGTLRFLDDQHGLAVYDIAGSFDGSRLQIQGVPKGAPKGVQLGNIDAVAALTPDGHFRGQWHSSIGTAGAFQLFPHLDPNSPSISTGPRELHTALKRVGVLRLGKSQVRELMRLMQSDFTAGQLLVTFDIQGVERTIYAVDFEQKTKSSTVLNRLRLQIQEPEGNGINRLLAVELDANTGNIVRAQSTQEAWAVGKAETIAQHLRRFRVRTATWLKKSSVLLIFLLAALLILSPEIKQIPARAAFVISVLVLLALAGQLLNRVVPDTAIYPSEDRQSSLTRMLPAVFAALVSVLTTVASGLIYAWLSGALKMDGH